MLTYLTILSQRNWVERGFSQWYIVVGVLRLHTPATTFFFASPQDK